MKAVECGVQSNQTARVEAPAGGHTTASAHLNQQHCASTTGWSGAFSWLVYRGPDMIH